MKKIITVIFVAFAFASCEKNKEASDNKESTANNYFTTSSDEKQQKDSKIDYVSFGKKITDEGLITKEEMFKKYKNLKKGDTITVKFKSVIKEVCQKKGCWMSMKLPGEKESFVRFLDYGFFVPLNAANQEAIVNGKAFVSEISVAQLKHYAKDGGKPQEEIDKITEPKITYAFQADGVLINK